MRHHELSRRLIDATDHSLYQDFRHLNIPSHVAQSTQTPEWDMLTRNGQRRVCVCVRVRNGCSQGDMHTNRAALCG